MHIETQCDDGVSLPLTHSDIHATVTYVCVMHVYMCIYMCVYTASDIVCAPVPAMRAFGCKRPSICKVVAWFERLKVDTCITNGLELACKVQRSIGTTSVIHRADAHGVSSDDQRPCSTIEDDECEDAIEHSDAVDAVAHIERPDNGTVRAGIERNVLEFVATQLFVIIDLSIAHP